MKSIRINDEDHAELVKRRDETGISMIFQVSRMISKTSETANDQDKEITTLPTIPK